MAPPNGNDHGGKMMKEGGNITILVLGDEGVGKSSLVSTFVSRHFSELVPGILTRVRLPPDPFLSHCTTTIIDTQEGDAALSSALSLGGGNRGGSLASINSASADSVSSLSRSNITNLAGSGELGGMAASGMASSKESSATNIMPTLKEGESKKFGQSASSKRQSRLAPTSPLRNVDAIVLIYDLDRMETFYRLENHWLPLIERCYEGELPVIVAGNKMDLLHQTSSVASASDNQFFARSRQQIISLLQRFKFVRQCIKCSAKNLLNVDEVFRKSQQSVLYPIKPLFDLNAGKLTSACVRAFTRIFRIFDADRDGLLSDAELNCFQHKVWGLALIERDFSGWKKVVAQHNSYFHRDNKDASGDNIEGEDVLRDGKFTVAGFMTIFDVFISQNRLEVPWKVLRTFGYDNDLNLNIPQSISPFEGGRLDLATIAPDRWRLNQSEVHFLTSIFRQFDSDGDGMLSADDMRSIFSVLPTPQPPWSERGEHLFEGCYSRPHVERDHVFLSSSMAGVAFDPLIEASPSPPVHPSSPSISASGITICSSSLPSVDVSKSSDTSSSSHHNEPMSYLEWMNHWHVMCTVSPSVCRAELFRLGHVLESNEENISCSRVREKSLATLTEAEPSVLVRALIFGSKDCGKFLVRKLSRTASKSATKTKKGLTWFSSMGMPETTSVVSQLPLPHLNKKEESQTPVHFVMTNVPGPSLFTNNDESGLKSKLEVLLGRQNGNAGGIYDIAVLAFDVSDAESFEFVKKFESDFLTEDMPRMYVGIAYGGGQQSSLLPAIEHCNTMDLEPPLVVTGDDSLLDSSAMGYFVRCTQQSDEVWTQLRSTPHGERKRREAAKRRKIIWIGAITAGITVVVGISTMTRDIKRGNILSEERRGRSWLRSTFTLVPRFVASMFHSIASIRQTAS